MKKVLKDQFWYDKRDRMWMKITSIATIVAILTLLTNGLLSAQGSASAFIGHTWLYDKAKLQVGQWNPRTGVEFVGKGKVVDVTATMGVQNLSSRRISPITYGELGLGFRFKPLDRTNAVQIGAKATGYIPLNKSSDFNFASLTADLLLGRDVARHISVYAKGSWGYALNPLRDSRYETKLTPNKVPISQLELGIMFRPWTRRYPCKDR